MANNYSNFTQAREHIENSFRIGSHKVHSDKWQGVNIADKPDMAMRELLGWSLRVPLSGKLEVLQNDIKPNLPWADDHFEERVCGEPLNPGVQWAKWPWSRNADKFRDDKGQFDHNYMERYWPKYANRTPEGKDIDTEIIMGRQRPHNGIRQPYGDLDDVVKQLRHDRLTRQAYFPIFFPEDTGNRHRGRVPCSLGHQFILRNNYFHHFYFIRSCDFIRHYNDDVYLSVRLHLWVLDELRMRDLLWDDVNLGFFTMHITSLHMFENDFITRYRNEDK